MLAATKTYLRNMVYCPSPDMPRLWLCFIPATATRVIVLPQFAFEPLTTYTPTFENVESSREVSSP